MSGPDRRCPAGPFPSGVSIAGLAHQQQIAPHPFQRVDAACFHPEDELRDVHTACRDLAIVHPALRLAKTLTEFTLGQARLVTQRAEECGKAGIGAGALRFDRDS